MTVYPGDSLDKLLQRERLFARLRLVALPLLAAGFVLDPRPVALPLALVLELIAAGFVLSLAAAVLLRYRRLSRLVAQLAAIGDVLFLIFFLAVSGGYASPLWPLALVLVAASTLRYGTRGGFFAAIVFASIQIVYGALEPGGLVSLADAGVRGLVLVVISLILGSIIQLERQQTMLDSDQSLQALQRSQSEVKSFAALSDAISSNTNYQATLRQMLEVSLRSLRSRGQPDDSMAGMILLFKGDPADSLLVAAQVRLDWKDAARLLSPITGSIKTVLNTVDPLLLLDVRADPLLGQFDIIQKFPAAAILPLRSGLTLFGVAVFMGLEKQLDVLGQRLELMEAYAAQAAIAVQNAQLFAQLDTERNSIVDSEERVRHELARDLHDGPVNQVASLAMGIDFARLLIDKEPQNARDELVNLQRLAAKTARDMRTTMYRLRPLALETLGLSVALDQYVTRLKADQHGKPDLHFASPDAAAFEKRLSSNAATMIFDIMNEAISNALKHAEAQNIWVELQNRGNVLVATARDDGKGFDVAGVQAGYTSRGSLGMVNIYERAALAQGDASIESEPGRGTTVSVRVPLSA